jgi:hypothetical protein
VDEARGRIRRLERVVVLTPSATGDQGGTFSISGNLPVGTTIDYPILPGGDCLSMLALGALNRRRHL